MGAGWEEEVKGWERGDICNTVHMRKKPCSRFFQLFLLACRVCRLQLSTAPPAPPRPFRNFRVKAPGCHSELVPSAALFAQQASGCCGSVPAPAAKRGPHKARLRIFAGGGLAFNP